MSGSLQDQLRKAGLTTDDKARKAKSEKRKQKRRERGAAAPVSSEAKLAAERAALEKAEHDRLLNLEHQQELDRRAAAGRLRQLIEKNRQSTEGGDLAYHFSDGSKIKTLYVTAMQQQFLAAGTLAIARLGDGYAVVPADLADRLTNIDANAVVSRAPGTEVPDKDDPYASYEVPDDLMW